jgi:hypothetical protein
MEKKRQSVRYEFFTFVNPDPTVTKSFTPVLNNPASVQFFCYNYGAPNPAGALINNIFNLNSVQEFNNGTGSFDYKLELNNNSNEIDNTNWNVTLSGTCNLLIVCKYYVK